MIFASENFFTGTVYHDYKSFPNGRIKGQSYIQFILQAKHNQVLFFCCGFALSVQFWIFEYDTKKFRWLATLTTLKKFSTGRIFRPVEI